MLLRRSSASDARSSWNPLAATLDTIRGTHEAGEQIYSVPFVPIVCYPYSGTVRSHCSSVRGASACPSCTEPRSLSCNAKFKPCPVSRALLSYFGVKNSFRGVLLDDMRLRQALCIVQAFVSAVAVEDGAAPAAKAASPKRAAQPEFTQQQRFVVPDEARDAFETAWAARRADMEQAPGFLAFEMKQDGRDYTVRSQWDSIPHWEAWNLSFSARRSHLPSVRPRGVPSGCAYSPTCGSMRKVGRERHGRERGMVQRLQQW
jgi:heme-degrading monooxygenase HmoA